jgi:hypothetical protein
VLLPVNGYAACSLEENTEGPDEPLVFHEVIDFHALSSGIQLTEDEIPVTRMRRKANDELVRMLHRNFLLPAHLLV